MDPPHIQAPEREAADLLLLRGVQRGDAADLDALINRYWLALVAYAARLLGDWDAAEDAGQEAFVRLWERREQWTTEGSVRALLYQMVRNVALNQLKGDDTHSRLLELRAEHPAPRTPVEELGAAEVQRAFEDAVADLPARRREVFLLARFDRLTHRQIAAVMEISPQTVANQLGAALAELRTRLGGLLDQPTAPEDSAREALRPR